MKKSYFYFFVKYLFFFREGFWKLRTSSVIDQNRWLSFHENTYLFTFSYILPALYMKMYKYFYTKIKMAKDTISEHSNIVISNIITEDLHLFTHEQ